MRDERKQAGIGDVMRYRPLVPVAVAFASGILLREYAELPSAVVLAATACAAGAWGLGAAFRLRGVGIAALYVALAAAGWLRLDWAAAPPQGQNLASLLGDEPKLVRLRGIVASDPEVQTLPAVPLAGESKWLAEPTEQTRLDLECTHLDANGEWVEVWGLVRLVDHGPPRTLRYGDRLVAVGMARLPSGPSNPGQLDAATLLRRKGIAATMSVGKGGLTLEPGGSGGIIRAIHDIRRSLRETLRTTLAPDKRAGALLCALVLGDRTEMGDDLEESFARTGTIHLLAVSGFNVAIVAWVIWLVAGLLGLGRRLSGALVLVAVVAYALVTGAPPSVVRAAVMTGAFVLAILGRRQFDPVHAVALAALVLLVLRPFDLFSVGFQLSFVAVLGIVFLTKDLAAVMRPPASLLEQVAGDEEVKWLRRFWWAAKPNLANAAAASPAASFAVAPLTAFYFHLFSPITVLVNLIAVPFAGMLTVAGFGHLALAGVSRTLAGGFAWLVRGNSLLLTLTVKLADNLPLAWVYCASPALSWVIIYYALSLVFVARRRLGLSTAKAASIWAAGALVFLFVGSSGGAPKGLEMTALDVQHGNATVLRFPDGSTVLYDCGTYGRNDVGRWAAAPALWHWGVRGLDLIIVTHADTDHLNGLPALIERFRIGQVIHSPVLGRAEAGRQLLEMLDRRRIPHQAAKAGDRFEVGRGNALEVLWPTDWSLRLRPNDQNENSLVVAVAYGGRRILLCADIQQLGATVLLHSGLDLRADVLVVPHHGCAMPNSEEFARAVRPAYAICSNRSDHLSADTLAAYKAVAARVLATCWDGAITVRIREGGLEAMGWKARTVPGRVTRDP